jgi:hypothetical protein
MGFWIFPIFVVLLAAGLWIGWSVYESKKLDRNIGTYRLISGSNGFYLGGDIPAEHWVRLTAHVIGTRLFYFRGTPNFQLMLESARNALQAPIVNILATPPRDGSEEQGVLSYGGIGLKGGVIGAGTDDDRPARYQREIEGTIRWVLEHEPTAKRARVTLERVINQEGNERLVSLGTVNKRIYKLLESS